MEDDEQEQRRRKVEAGRAKLAHFRQRKTKGDCANSKKKTAKRKGSTVDAPVPEESPVATQESGLLRGEIVCESSSCSDTLDEARGACAAQEQEQGHELGSRLKDRAGGQQQPQTAHGLELEALRLSLNNMHTAQLELTQANLQKEKETALTELRDMLNGRRAQELALLQSRQQCELELVREQHAREMEALALRCGHETAELKEKLRSEMEKNVQAVESLKQDWESEKELCLENLRKELSAKHQSEMEVLQNQFQKELAEHRAEMEKIFEAKNQAEASLKSLEVQHQATSGKVPGDLQVELHHPGEDLELKFREKEKEKQLELERLQASYEDLKAQSQEEIRRLWAQLESVRSSREELNESWEPLLAQASHLEELEHLRKDFAKQQQRDRAQHESELEQLRVYFEKKLRDAEKTYQEDLTLFQQRLQETREDSLLGSAEVSSSCVCLEETSGREGEEHPDQLHLQLEQQQESLTCSHTGLEDDHGCESGALSPSLHDQLAEDKPDRCCLGPEELELERLPSTLSGQDSQELAQMQLQGVWDEALETDMQVAAKVLDLEVEHKVKLSLLESQLKEEIELLKIENRNLREKVQHETRLREDLENVKRSLVEDQQEELNKAEEKIQLMKQVFKQREAEWELSRENLKKEAEERLAAVLLELREKAESEKQSIIHRFELRETGMRHLQDQQAAQILDLERSLMEQQGRLRQLEQELAGDEALPCSQDGPGSLAAHHREHGKLLCEEEDCAFQLMLAQNRFLEERREIMETFAAEQDALLQEAQKQHGRELQHLQQGHQQQLLSLKAELERRHQAELAERTASLEGEQQALLETRVAELQVKQAAEIRTLERRHSSHLDALESCYLADVQTVRDEHRRALELLRAELEEQLQRKDSSHRAALTQELERLKLKHEEELQSTQERLRAELDAQHTGRLEALAAELQGVHQLRGQVLSLSQEVEESHAELERLQQRRERENQESTTLVNMLRADLDQAQSEGRALRDALGRLLGVLGETLKAAVTLKSRIGERVGFFLDHVGAAGAGQAPSADAGTRTAPALDDTWSDTALLELNRTLPEGAEMSSVAEISSHVCESFFMSPENTLECEQPIRRVYQSLAEAVDGLLDMALDSSRQLEEARQIHSRVEKEFSRKSEETAQAVLKHQQLLECLREESTAKAKLALELHTAEGLLEGFKVEKADLQEALGRKEESEQQLVLELESLRQQLQRAGQELAVLREESVALWNQREAAAVEAEAREAALRKEVESLAREQSEARKQSEKDRAALLSQMQALESELEDQLSQCRGRAEQAEEVTALKQQLATLDKHLRSQRQFMDEQAAEREHEREEFQQEIQRLEAQLRQAARPRPPGPHDSQVESLQEKLREKSDGFNELAIRKELADRQLLIQEEEIKHLKETNASTRRQVAQLQEELEKQKKTVREWQDEEALKEQQTRDLLLIPVPQDRLCGGQGPSPPVGCAPEGPEIQLEVAQRTLLQRENEVLDLKEQLEKIKDDLVSKNEEILRLNLKLDVQNNPAAPSTGELPGEDATSKVVYSRGSEIEELKAIIENLKENQERLQKDKAEEVEQLHEVIEKLQSELSLMGPVVHELSDRQADSLHRELLCLQDEDPGRCLLQAELETAIEAKEALSQLLADQAHRHSQALEALQQRLQAAEATAAQRLTELGRSVALREAEAEGMASRIREFEAVLKAKEAIIVQRDLEIDTMNRRKAAHSLELEAILVALARFRCALEQQPLAALDEPPELQQLRAQCTCLARQLQVLHQQLLRCQVVWGQQQEPGAHPQPHEDAQAEHDGQSEQGSGSRWLASSPQGWGPQDNLQPARILVTPKDADLHKAESLMSVLTVCQRHLEAELLLVKNERCLSMEDSHRVPEGTQGKEKYLEGCQLHGVALVAQVKRLQEKLNRLVYSVALQNIETADPKLQWPLASPCLSESGSSDRSNGEETDMLPPVDTVNIDKTTWDLIDVKNQDSLIQNEVPYFPTQERLASQDGPLSSHISAHGASLPTEEAEPQQDLLKTHDLSSWSSPEVLRNDATPEPEPSLPLTPCSGAVSLPNSDVSLQDQTGSLLPASMLGLLCYPGESAAGQAPQWGVAASADHHVEKTAAEKDVEDFIITSSDSREPLRSTPLGLEGRSNGSGESGGPGASAMLTPCSGGPEAPIAGPGVAAAPVSISGGFPRPRRAMKEKDVHEKPMKALLQMVVDESHQILALSESRDSPSALSKGEPRAPLDGFPREGQGLLEAAPEKGEKEHSDTHVAWSRELLPAVQEVSEAEKETLNVELQHRACGPHEGYSSSLLERLEKVIREQGDPQEKGTEPLSLPDRSSLLSEIQALRAQLRMTHLQNQEKLQHLCAALTSTEARGSRREHQLRRQVELLAYKVEQEKHIASDLQKTLNKEQEKASDARMRLVEEQSAVQDLKSELHECKQENAGLLESLSEVQRETLQLRSLLDGKEKDLKMALAELECEREKERALQAQQEEHRLQLLQREGQSAKALEELKVSLEKQRAQNNQLCVALKHERAAKDNLQKELQIECSRCEALLAQEQGRLSELQKSLEAEKSRSLELSEALRHERLLTEQLSRSTQEACNRQETQAHHAMLRKLKAEKARTLELQVALEKAQQQLEAQAPAQVELRREQEVSAAPRSASDALQMQKQELRCCLERKGEKPAWLQADLEQLPARVKEQEGHKNARVETGLSRADAEKWKKRQRDKEKLRELELQHQRDEHKIKQLQQTVRELQQRGDMAPGDGPRLGSLELDHLWEQQQELEKIRQQLLCATGLLTNFVRHTVDRTISDWTSSNEKAVSALVRTLEELKSELSGPTSSQKKTAAELQVQLVDMLLRDNDSLTKAVSTATQEKAELCRAVSRLERTLKHHVQRGCSLSRPGRSASKQEKTVLQSSPQHPDPGWPMPATSDEANNCNVKMEKLYLHYLRAESFRKALIYQKKYLLLLIGGFQDSEQETLSMIAHLGVFPSKADRKITTSRPFTKFRTAVRVVIAVLRLRFLVKKWQEVDRKGALVHGRASRPGPRVPRWQQSPLVTRESPPTRDVSSGHTKDSAQGRGPTAVASRGRGDRSTSSPSSRSERSLTASQDPEHSLTEYILHLEMIQQRLGGLPQDLTSKKSCHQKIKQ